MDQLRPLAIGLVFLAAAAYMGGIVWAGVESLQSPTEPILPEIVTNAVTAIGGALATHFGASFGLARFTGRSLSPDPIRPWHVRAWAATLPQDRGTADELSASQWIQVGAAYLYVISLLMAAVFWGLDDLFSPNSAILLRNMTFTLVGVAVGVLTVTLNVGLRGSDDAG